MCVCLRWNIWGIEQRIPPVACVTMPTHDHSVVLSSASLPLPLPLPQVRVLFGERSLEMWAVGQAAAYHLHLPRLYGRLIVHKCGVKVATVGRCGCFAVCGGGCVGVGGGGGGSSHTHFSLQRGR